MCILKGVSFMIAQYEHQAPLLALPSRILCAACERRKKYRNDLSTHELHAIHRALRVDLKKICAAAGILASFAHAVRQLRKIHIAYRSNLRVKIWNAMVTVRNFQGATGSIPKVLSRMSTEWLLFKTQFKT
jgi:hypothetical protein